MRALDGLYARRRLILRRFRARSGRVLRTFFRAGSPSGTMAPADDDISIEEKRVYAGTSGRTDAYLAADVGVVRVAISDDIVGEFDLATREPARDVAILPAGIGHDQDGGRTDGTEPADEFERPDGDERHVLLAVATDDDLKLAPLEPDPASTGELTFVDAGVGSTVAVGTHDGGFLVAGADGTISHVAEVGTVDSGAAGSDVSSRSTGADGPTPNALIADRLGDVPDPRAVDGPLIAAADGVHRAASRGGSRTVERVGLDDVRDVAGGGIPLAATPDGLYWLGNGWMDAIDGDFDVVAADGRGHAMAGGEGSLWVRHGDPTGDEASGSAGWGVDAWSRAELPVDAQIAALGYGPGLSVAVTGTGAVCVDVGGGWRHRTVGVAGVSGVALTPIDD